MKTLTQGGPLNQPWGFAAAPSKFGPFSNTLLVSNNTDTGTINAFNAINGQFVGTIKDTNGNVIHIDQLWAIDFGDGLGANGDKNTLFFTAGPDNNFAGLFGKILFKWCASWAETSGQFRTRHTSRVPKPGDSGAPFLADFARIGAPSHPVVPISRGSGNFFRTGVASDRF